MWRSFENVLTTENTQTLILTLLWNGHNHILFFKCASVHWIILAHGTTKYNSIFVFGHTVILLFSSNQSKCIDTTQVYKLEAKFVSRHNKSYPRLDDKTVAVFRTCHVFRSSDSVPSSSSNLSKASLSSLRLSIQGLHKWKIPALPETRTALQKKFQKEYSFKWNKH